MAGTTRPPVVPSDMLTLHRFTVGAWFARLLLLPLFAFAAAVSLRAQVSWTSVASPTAQNLWSVAYSPDHARFVAVGENGTILTQSAPDPAFVWTPRTSGTTRWLTAVAYGGSQFVAVGDTGTVVTSPDGLVWTARTVDNNPSTTRLNAVSYGNGTYVAVSERGTVYTSPDSVTWRSDSNAFRARGLAFAYGNFVTTGDLGRIGVSATGSNFNPLSLGTPSFIEGVAYARRQFVAVGENGFVATSPSAEIWTGRPTPTSAHLRGVTFFNHHFVAVGENGTVLTSPDGITWSLRPVTGTPLFTAVATNGQIAVAVGHNGAIHVATKSPSIATTIVTPPADVTEAAGSHVLFSVVGIGPDTLSYQWFFNNTAIAGATDDTLLLKNIQAADAGRYTVSIASPASPASTPTASATLTVIPAFPPPLNLIDPTFTAAPVFNLPPATAIEQPDGKLIVGGNFVVLVNGVGQVGLARLNLDGSLDPSFNAGSGASGGERVTALALQPDGKVLAGGTFTAMSGTARPNLARLLATGALDPTFAPPASLAASPVTQIVVQADGKILVVLQNNQLTRLNADGSLDTTFTPPDSSFPVVRVAVTSGGKILVGGGQFGSEAATIKRLNTDGSIDPTFTTAKLSISGLQYLRVLADGRIAAAAYSAVTVGSWSLARFNADGTPDLTYPARTGGLNRNSAIFASDAEGRVSLHITTSPFISFSGSFYRLRADGSLDSTLRLSTPVTTSLSFTSIVPLSSGKLLFLGGFTSVDGTPRTYVARTVVANASLLNPPVIATTSPQIVHVRAGEPVTLNVTTAGSRPFTTTWSSPGSPSGVASADGSTYTIASAQLNGLYSATIANAAGSLTSPVFLVLVDPSAPVLAAAPANLSVNAARTAVFTVAARGSLPLTYQWFFNDTPVGTNGPTLVVSNVTAAQAGLYTVVIRNSLGTITSPPARLTVDDTARLANLATRGLVGLGENVLTTGFVLSGPVPRTVIIRGIGPGLTQFGLTGTVPDPQIALFDNAGNKLAENDNWGAPASGATAAIFQQWGAFALGTASLDAALVRTLAPGAYTVQVSGNPAGADGGGVTGLALAEIYEADLLPSRLVNLSSRLVVGEGASVAIPGIVVSGTVPRKLLIRAVGPALGAFGVAGFLPDPALTLTTPTGTVVATNNDWSASPNAAELVATTAQVGAFALSAGSKDSALLVTVPPGNYTAQVTGAPGTSGVALVEIYEVP